jgi:hypothetical protein
MRKALPGKIQIKLRHYALKQGSKGHSKQKSFSKGIIKNECNTFA